MSQPSVEPTPGPAVEEAAAPLAAGAAAAGQRGRRLEPGELPPSLEGTEVDGELTADASGRFVPLPGALRLFDYYLSARDQEPESWTRARVLNAVETQLPASAQADAVALFETYLRYLEAGSELTVEGMDPEDMERRLQRLRELRREIFGAATAAALFDEQERMDQVAIERRRILNDPTLNDRERIQRLAELQTALPEDVRRAEAEAYAPLRLAREEERLRAAGASEEEIEALRDRSVGPDAAERLEALDRTREAWSTRMQAYREERDTVLDNVRNAPDEAKAVFLRRVRERHFAPEEIPRVEALDRIELRDRSLGNAPVTVQEP